MQDEVKPIMDQVLITCPLCGLDNHLPTLTEGTEMYTQDEVPIHVGKRILNLISECAGCNEQFRIGGTHPLFMTINLYHYKG